ncbi:MAG: glycogen/starch/alpha-glucan phosphorylase [Victivallales bacterium]|nr:glycogen/starch/alpha-glucan phosphorylase [Victivallales bacterium]
MSENTKQVFDPESLSTSHSVDSLRLGLDWHLYHTQATSAFKETDNDWYQAFSATVRDRMVTQWMKTQDTYSKHQVRRAYYLSLEFLIGRLLGNNAMNLKMYDACAIALKGSRLEWEDLQELERDPGLGNGGLGRLAACFVDSLATMHLPCIGYGLRYDYGIFRQQVVNGAQVEEPDAWKQDGYPWEFRRPDRVHTVCFGGEIRQLDVDGRPVWRWFPAERVLGMPYDIPVVGYGGQTVNNLRLWSCQACNDFDFQDFNQGSYTEAVESRIMAENLTRVLYPNDNIAQGKELRLRQQYFFVACSLHDIIRRHLKEGGTLRSLPEKVSIQLNDTHPSLVIPELMRVLMDENGLEWDEAWEITRSCTNYTNHTILPEALEKWSVPLFRKVLPRHLQIIFDLNSRFLNEVSARYPGDMDKLRRMSLVEEGGVQCVRMANLAVVGSTHVNGVAKIHSDILRKDIFRDFAELWPEKFTNMTNGITQRRWLLLANRDLARLISSRIGDGWISDLSQLVNLEQFIEEDAFLEELLRVKRTNKLRLASEIEKTVGVAVDPDSIFDVQVKRLHEYKRQLMLVLYIITIYNRLKRNPELDYPPRTFIFAAKAAPGYAMAKLIIRLIHAVAKVVNDDPVVANRLKVVFLPDYRVSLAQIIIPAADVSEQISLAGTEASGTGCMKLMLNGALTIGTLDGANVEMLQEVGEENIFIFGMTAEEVARRRASYSPWDLYHTDPEIQETIGAIRDNCFSPLEPGLFQPIVQALLDFGDRYMLLADLKSYISAQERISQLSRDQKAWARMSLRNIARSGKFSSDRTIAEYAEQIWHIKPILPEETP